MDWSIIVMALPILAVGLLATLKVCLAAIAIGIVLGFALGFGALSRFRAIRIAVLAYVDFVRGTPLLVQIFLVYFALPVIGINFNEYWAGVIALSLNAGGFICEIVRASMQSVDHGQTEAAQSIGMRHGQIVLHVLFPQAWRRILPPLTNELISLIKGSALLSAISVYELTHAGQEIIATYFSPFEIFLLIALYYYALISALAWLSRYLERRLPQY
ncbi:amino acid ABC transporter permease [Paraburkholderia silvatlantica]|uniref:Polar amino acid transport system permease protein n=1 Tax=Paraburkholderia silvatlantica TaxID=321895 RepID=A0ABR6FKK3_9BURK|nr:amino acid ABC transporter permease [Paraburkholderia silvatlantica]MBB2927952.1 polar amino acid transport system permease protein [Paraburkholderia silvatlantica]PVY27486.1 amino acid ABC transporter membrane protein (PAAT family) [Paraburkholderia silvatlantica]PXW34459.1 amino acid ABC transporter membrane protein (PAAT family) [Paraburkholderia silvatlantica]TDQ72306.1 amino acid ABC transporter membrane protein (PAAT family) [Paraburkholderia silvatlantica]